MKASFFTSCLISLQCSLAIADPAKGEVDPNKIPRPQPHYQTEYTFDTNTDVAAWATQKPGLHAAFGSTDELYLRCEVPGVDAASQAWEATGWRGERLNAQALLWSPEPLKQLRVQVSDLQNGRQHLIPNTQTKLHLVRYVLSNFPYQATGFSCDVTNGSAFLLPDRLEDFERFDLPARTVRPVWLTVDIPAKAEAGDYEGTLKIDSESQHVELRMKIQIQDRTLPPPRDWKFRLDLWQNPWVIASYFGVPPWSEDHKVLLRKHLKLYADAGGSYITTYAVHSPWSDNSYALEGTMIGWTKTAAGAWKFDYSIFDQYVELAMEAGINKAITIYTPVPWGFRFRYLDEASGNFVHETWPPASAAFKTVWKSFLDDLQAHLKHKGWFEKTYLGINENPHDVTMAAVNVIKEHSKQWKITYAGDWHAELSPVLDDYSVIITKEPGAAELRTRSRSGATTTFYVCCNPPQPNNFIFSAPVEGRYIGWYAAAYGYSGFLRWAYDAWPADPLRDARHTLWPAGDCFLVYPGGNSSLRFEKLREGIVDYEKIRILRESAQRSTNPRAKELLANLDNHLASLTGERDHCKEDYSASKLTEAVARGRKLVEALSQEVSR